jgi:hypothetical protein
VPAEPGPSPLSNADRALLTAILPPGTHGLSDRDQVDILGALGLLLNAEGRVVDGACEEPVFPQFRFLDLDEDGTEEVIVDSGNTCVSGMTGTSVWLFVKDATGRYRSNLGFPGMIDFLPTSNLGFPDLLIGGPGFCFPVWRWNGQEYDFLRSAPQSPTGCDNR